MGNEKSGNYRLVLALYLLLACSAGALYSFYSMPFIYYQDNIINLVVISALSFIPYILLSLLLGILMLLSKGWIVSKDVPHSWHTIIRLLFAAIIISVCIVVFASYIQSGQGTTIGSGKGILQSCGLWVGGCSVGLTVLYLECFALIRNRDNSFN